MEQPQHCHFRFLPKKPLQETSNSQAIFYQLSVSVSLSEVLVLGPHELSIHVWHASIGTDSVASENLGHGGSGPKNRVVALKNAKKCHKMPNEPAAIYRRNLI